MFENYISSFLFVSQRDIKMTNLLRSALIMANDLNRTCMIVA